MEERPRSTGCPAYGTAFDPTCGTGVAPSRWFEHLNDGLPPQLARFKAAGDFARATRLIDEALATGATPELTQVMLVERARMEAIPHAYPYTRAAALDLLRAEVPGFTESQLDELIDRGRIDWRYVEGEQRIIETFLDSLRIYADEVPGMEPLPAQDLSERDAMLDEMRARGYAARRVVLRATIEVAEGGAEDEDEGEDDLRERIAGADVVRAWLPIPAPCQQQSDIVILDATPAGVRIAPEDALQRTVYWEARGDGTGRLARCDVTYAYTSRAPWHDMAAVEAQEAELGPRKTESLLSAPELAPYLCEQEPHIVFTPYLRELSARIVAEAGAVTPTQKALAIYRWVTETVDYRYQPPYFLLDCIPQMAATEMRADCGVFALTFITLCRIAGVPARWQSGLYVRPTEASPHDWAQFYSPSAGWLWADCSFGSAGRRTGDLRKREHYFGNLDPWRMVANGEFFAPLTPPFDGMRFDPFDNQRGEMSVDGVGVAADRLNLRVEVVSMERVE